MTRELTWLVAANAIFVLGGLVAYSTSLSLPIVAAFALVAAVAGLWRLKDQPGPFQQGADLGASIAAGAWAVVAVLVLLPYITVEEGRSLWASAPYAGLSIAVASLGMLGWNAAVLASVPSGRRQVRTFVIFHAALVVVAFALVLRGDGTLVPITLRGFELTAHDLQLAPALAAAPGLSWAMGLWAQRNEPST